MPRFELKEFLEAVGPTASLIFAAWIFLSFLQTRYTAAYERYRALISEFRQHSNRDARRDSLRDQIFEYKRRCEQMRAATQIGVLAAISLITALICAGLNVVYDELTVLKYLTAVGAILGLALVVWAAVIVLAENARLQLIIESDLSDIDELRDGARDPRRVGAQRGEIPQRSRQA
jgi:DNA-binding transcriptional regulator YbjK